MRMKILKVNSVTRVIKQVVICHLELSVKKRVGKKVDKILGVRFLRLFFFFYVPNMGLQLFFTFLRALNSIGKGSKILTLFYVEPGPERVQLE